jgi:hypothetical protein
MIPAFIKKPAEHPTSRLNHFWLKDSDGPVQPSKAELAELPPWRNLAIRDSSEIPNEFLEISIQKNI